jgi:hypothetical protein
MSRGGGSVCLKSLENAILKSQVSSDGRMKHWWCKRRSKIAAPVGAV